MEGIKINTLTSLTVISKSSSSYFPETLDLDSLYLKSLSKLLNISYDSFQWIRLLTLSTLVP